MIQRILLFSSEYYFSEDNLIRDLYLRRKMNPEGFLPVTLIATFHRVQALTADINMIISAIQESDKLELVNNYNVRTKNNPTRWPIDLVATTETQEEQQVEVASTMLSSIPPPPTPRNGRHQTVPANVPFVIPVVDAQVVQAAPIMVAAKTPTTSESENLNPNVPEFIPTPEIQRKLSSERALQQAAVEAANQKENIVEDQQLPKNDEEKSDPQPNDTSIVTEEAELWKEVKRRSRSAQPHHQTTTQQESHEGQTQCKDLSKKNQRIEQALTTGRGPISRDVVALLTGSSQPGEEREELDFQFDEELDLPRGGGRVNHFTDTLSDEDDESDYELSDHDINKLLIVTQVSFITSHALECIITIHLIFVPTGTRSSSETRWLRSDG